VSRLSLAPPLVPAHMKGLIILVCRTKAFPTGATTAMDIGLSNLSLKFITLSFYSAPLCSRVSMVD